MGEMVSVPGKEHVSVYVAKPAGDAKGAVIVIHEAWGLNDHVKSIADRIAETGYVGIAPDMLANDEIARIATPELQESLFDPERRNEVQTQLRKIMSPIMSPEFGTIALARLREVFDYAYDMPEVGKAVAVMGYCFGGTYSYSLAVVEPRLKLALPFYGHSDHTVEELRGIKAPIRAFYGEKDERLMAGLDDLKARMKEAGVNYEAKVYANCGHAFFNDSNRFAYNKEAATDAWERVQKYLSEYVQIA